MEKFTARTKKQELIDYLRAAKVSDKNLMERIRYALKMVKSDITRVRQADLLELAREVLSLSKSTPAPVEASLKPKKTGKKTAPEPVEEDSDAEDEDLDDEDDAEAEEEVPEKKPTKKSKTKALKKNASAVETLPAASTKGVDNLPSAMMFPKEIEHPDLGKLVSCAGHYETYADIIAALEAEKTLYFACYWTKRQIKEFSYEATRMVKAPKNGFPYDLDILTAVIPCETIERIFAMSSYTEALFQFEGEDFKPIEDTDPRSGKKFRVRVSAGLEFEVYRPADEDILTLDDDEEDDEE